MEKKKFEILIPEITTVADLRGDSVVAGTLIKEEAKLIGDNLQGAFNKLEVNSGPKSKGNEESASTTNLSKGDGSAKTSPVKPGGAAEVAAKPAADENAIYRYKPIFKLPKYQIKYMETVYEGFEDFSFNEVNYEVTNKDLHFLE